MSRHAVTLGLTKVRHPSLQDEIWDRYGSTRLVTSCKASANEDPAKAELLNQIRKSWDLQARPGPLKAIGLR